MVLGNTPALLHCTPRWPGPAIHARHAPRHALPRAPLQLCTLSGCDYLDNIPNYAIKKIHKLLGELQCGLKASGGALLLGALLAGRADHALLDVVRVPACAQPCRVLLCRARTAPALHQQRNPRAVGRRPQVIDTLRGRLGSGTVPHGYELQFLRAKAVFRHQTVYCTQQVRYHVSTMTCIEFSM